MTGIVKELKMIWNSSLPRDPKLGAVLARGRSWRVGGVLL
jgi:hypothetical protein